MTRQASLAYGIPALPLALGALPLYLYLPAHYATRHGMELALLGSLLLLLRLGDALSDPWLGWLADRWPRRRVLGVALLCFALGFIAAFNPPSEATVPWLVGSLILTGAGLSAGTIAHQAWGASLGQSPGERTELTAVREAWALCGVILAALAAGSPAGAPLVLSASVLPLVLAVGWFSLRVLPERAVVAAAARVHTASLPEAPAPEGEPPRAGSSSAAAAPLAAPAAPWAALRLVLADPPWRALLGIFLLNGIAAALPATLFLFFVADVLRLPGLGGVLLALYFVAGALSLPVWVRLAARWGRVRAWQAGMLLSMFAFAGAFGLGAGDAWPFALVCLGAGLALGADLALPGALAADLAVRSGRAGACFGAWNLVSKLGLALAAGLALPLLDALGYRPGAVDDAAGLLALQQLYVLLPLALRGLAVVLLWRDVDILEKTP